MGKMNNTHTTHGATAQREDTDLGQWRPEEGPTTVLSDESREEMLRALHLLAEPGQVVELRALDVSEPYGYRQPHTVAGYFNDLDALADAAMEVGPHAKGVYVTLNSVQPALLARAANRAKAMGKSDATTADKDIRVRRWLPIDTDPRRAAGISSSESEHAAALQRSEAIATFLCELGWHQPLRADSGNGGHLLYLVDLPADDGGLVQRFLNALAAKFSDEAVDVDVTVYNPARIWKLYGSVARKGDSVPERPHRQAHLLDVPEQLVPMQRDVVEWAVERLTPAATSEADHDERDRGREPGGSSRQASAPTGSGAVDLDTWITAHDLDVGEAQPWDGPDGKPGRKWVFRVCLFNPEHTNRSAVLLHLANGAIAFRCHHAGCTGNDWHALRALVDGDATGQGDARRTRATGHKARNTVDGDGAVPHTPASADPTMPLGYVATNDGLVKVTRSAQGGSTRHVIAFAQQVVIKSRITEVTNGVHWLRLAWQQDGVWHETVAERQTVMNARELVKLASVGFPVTSLNERELTAYLDAYEHHNRGRLPVERVSGRLGWQDDHTFLWGHQSLSVAPRSGGGAADATAEAPADGGPATETAGDAVPGATLSFRAASSGDAQLADACQSAGTLDGWIAAVAPGGDYPAVQCALYAALTAPLLKLLDVANFVVDLSGRTSTGKTTALRVAASAAGNPDERATAGLIGSWDTTRVAIERRCATSTDLPVFLDDTKRAKKAEEVGALLYEVANGKGRDRGSLAGRDRTASWRTVVLSTGEAPATSFTQDGGTRGRVLSFNGLPFSCPRGGTTTAESGTDRSSRDTGDTATLVHALNSGVRRHFGHALPLFVKWLQAHLDEQSQWRDEYQAVRDHLPATNEVAYRLAAYFAAVQYTATLVHRAFADDAHPLPWTPCLDGLWATLAAGTDEANTDLRALKEVYTWASCHEAEFYRPLRLVKPRHTYSLDSDPDTVRETPRTGWLGKWDQGDWVEIAFYPEKLRAFLDGAGYRVEEVCSGWKERGWLRLEPDGKHPKVRMAADSRSQRDPRPWLVVVTRDAFIAVGAVDASTWDTLAAEADADDRQALQMLPRLEHLGVVVRVPPEQQRLSNEQLVALLDRKFPWPHAVRLTRDQARRIVSKGRQWQTSGDEDEEAAEAA